MSQPTIDDVAAAVRSVLSGRLGPRSNGRRPAEVFAERLLSLRQAEALPGGIVEVRVAPGTVITPLARDFLKRQGIGVTVVARSDVERARAPGEWGFAIEGESGLLAAVRRVLLEEAMPWREIEPSGQAAARWVAEASGRGAMLLTDESSVAVWRACGMPGVRAASACDVDAVDRAVRRLGVNLLVIEPSGKSIALVKQMGRAFRLRGAPRPPEGLALEESS